MSEYGVATNINGEVVEVVKPRIDERVHAVENPVASGTTTQRPIGDRFADVLHIKDFGAKGDGVTNDTAAFVSAQNSICNVGDGTYLVTSLSGLKNTKMYGYAHLSVNGATIPVHKCATESFSLSSFTSLAQMLEWVSHLEGGSVTITLTGSTITTLDLDLLGEYAKHNSVTINASGMTINTVHISNGGSVKINSGSFKHIDVSNNSRLELSNPTFIATTDTAHIFAYNRGVIKISGTETVNGSAANFHFWVRGASSLDISDLQTKVNNTPKFEYFAYIEEQSYCLADRYRWTGAVRETKGFTVCQNSMVNCDKSTFDEYCVFFPSNHQLTDGATGDLYVSQPNGGGRFNQYPDYGYYIMDMDVSLLNKTEFKRFNIPDAFSTLTIEFSGVRIANNGTLYIQVRPISGSYLTEGSDYIGIDTQIISGADSGTPFSLDSSVSMSYFGGGTKEAFGQITILPYSGICRAQYFGYIVDCAGVKHSLNGMINTKEWIRAIRLLAPTGFTAGTVSVTANL